MVRPSKKNKSDEGGDSARARGSSAGARPRREVDNKASGSGKKFVLIIGDEGAILVYMHGSKVVRRLYAPSAQPAHTEAMRDIMSASPRVSLYILADVLDQQYVSHTFPPVSSLSVSGLVRRRLDRDFQTEDMKGALPMGRDKTGRKEWKFLLVSLAKTPMMTEWLDLVLELPNKLAGVYLVPIEAQNYLLMLNKKLAGSKARPWQLLISHNKVSGFRQVVVHQGKLVFTRVSQAIDDAIPAVIAGNIEQEAINTMEYLKRLGFQENAELDATVVVSPDVIPLLDFGRFGFGSAQIVSPLQVAEALKLEQAALSADRFGDVVMAAAFGVSKKQVLRFSTVYMEKLAKLYKTQLGIRAASALAALVLLGMTALAAVDIAGYFSSISESQAKSAQALPELEKYKKVVDGLNKNVAFKSAVVATYDVYLKNSTKPEMFAKMLMPLLSPQYSVMSMEWSFAEGGATKGTAIPGAAGSEALPLEVKLQFDFSSSGANAEALTKSANALIETLKIKMPEFEVSADPFPWNKQGTSDTVVLSAVQATPLLPADMIATIKFRGMKKVKPASPSSAQKAAAK